MSRGDGILPVPADGATTASLRVREKRCQTGPNIHGAYRSGLPVTVASRARRDIRRSACVAYSHRPSSWVRRWGCSGEFLSSGYAGARSGSGQGYLTPEAILLAVRTVTPSAD